jgi:purine-binding chemotaxis protein CheW
MIQPVQIATDHIVVFTLDEQSFALSLPVVIKVIHAIEIRHLPKAPEIIIGIINVNGRIIPVADIRKRFGLEVHETDLDDQIIIADTGKREVGILVNSVTGVFDLTSQQLFENEKKLSFAEHISGVAKVDSGLILIYDLDRFLSLDEEKELDKAMNPER